MGPARQLLGRKERSPRPQDARHHGRQRLHHLDAAVRDRALRRAPPLDRRRPDLRAVRDLPGDLRGLRLRHPVGDPGLSRVADAARRPCRGAVRSILLVRPRDDHRPSGRAAVRASAARPRRPAVRLRRNRVRGRRLDHPLAPQRPRRTQGRARRGDELSLARHAADRRQRRRRHPAAPPAAAQMERPADPPVDRRRRGCGPCPGGDSDVPRLLRHRPAAFDAVGFGRTGVDRDDGRGGGDARRAMGPDPAARSRAAPADPVGRAGRRRRPPRHDAVL